MVIKTLRAISKLVGDKPTVREERNGTIHVMDKTSEMCITIGPGSLQALVKSLAGQVEKGSIIRGTPEPDEEMCFDADLLRKALRAFPAKTTVRIGVTPYEGWDHGLLYIRGSTLPDFNGEAINVILCGVVEEPEVDGSRPSDRVVLTKDVLNTEEKECKMETYSIYDDCPFKETIEEWDDDDGDIVALLCESCPDRDKCNGGE